MRSVSRKYPIVAVVFCLCPPLTPPVCEHVLGVLTIAALRQAEQQLVQLREVASEKQKADEKTKKISAEAQQATAGDGSSKYAGLRASREQS